MECLLITIITAGLALFDIITVETFMIVAALSVVWTIVAAGLYFRFGFLKCYYHDLLGWHTPMHDIHWWDGCSNQSKCKHCGKDILQDSQGNWFVA